MSYFITSNFLQSYLCNELICNELFFKELFMNRFNSFDETYCKIQYESRKINTHERAVNLSHNCIAKKWSVTCEGFSYIQIQSVVFQYIDYPLSGSRSGVCKTVSRFYTNLYLNVYASSVRFRTRLSENSSSLKKRSTITSNKSFLLFNNCFKALQLFARCIENEQVCCTRFIAASSDVITSNPA